MWRAWKLRQWKQRAARRRKCGGAAGWNGDAKYFAEYCMRCYFAIMCSIHSEIIAFLAATHFFSRIFMKRRQMLSSSWHEIPNLCEYNANLHRNFVIFANRLHNITLCKKSRHFFPAQPKFERKDGKKAKTVAFICEDTAQNENKIVMNSNE